MICKRRFRGVKNFKRVVYPTPTKTRFGPTPTQRFFEKLTPSAAFSRAATLYHSDIAPVTRVVTAVTVDPAHIRQTGHVALNACGVCYVEQARLAGSNYRFGTQYLWRLGNPDRLRLVRFVQYVI
jgi:hypothetical protein